MARLTLFLVVVWLAVPFGVSVVQAQGCDRRLPWTCLFVDPFFPTLPPVGEPLDIDPSRQSPQAEPDVVDEPDVRNDRNITTGSVDIYARIDNERFPIPAAPLSRIDPRFLRQVVVYPTREPAGTIVIDVHNRFLYLVQNQSRAVRYGVGVGRQGFEWSGVASVHSKQEWPDWYPPKDMIERQPELRQRLSELQSGLGMAGGPGNPLGARAMYLWENNKDTLYRIHGTVEPWTIGKSVSSGCIRMINQDVIDLYNRIPTGARVVVLPAG